MFIEETSMEMEEQPKMEHMPKQVEGTNLELYKTDVNAMTRELGNIFEWKDVWERLELSCNSSQTKDASTQPLTPSKGSDMESVSTGIYASSISSHSGEVTQMGP